MKINTKVRYGLVNCVCPNNESNRSTTCPAKDYWFGLNSQIKSLIQESTIDALVQNSKNLELNRQNIY